MIEISVDFNKKVKAMKPLHGINNGPISRGLANDTSFFYKKINPPYARLHDTHYPESREVDIHTIFPDFSKDEKDPNSYYFKITDNYLESILKLGTDIIYRLGETIASADKFDYIHPPADFKKYARVCVNIIRHCNDGWADGFHYNIRHWEIWNEPSVPNMWTGTMNQWLMLYREIALAIREYNPDLLIGGPAACDPKSPINIPFLEYVRGNNLPLDFYTFHCYTHGSEQAYEFLGIMKENLEMNGFDDIPAYITEWNFVPRGDDGRIWWECMPTYDQLQKTAMFRRMVSEEGASHVAMFLSLLQDSFIYQANFYQASPEGRFSCFNKYCMPEKNYYALLAFRELYELGYQAEAAFERPLADASVLAAADGKSGRILISNLNNGEEEFSIKIKGNFKKLKSVRVINKNLDLMPLKLKNLKGPIFNFRIPKHTVVLIDVL
jgi:hypothetical protein